MQNKPLLWQTFRQAKEWNERPSKIIGVNDDEYAAWCFDEACHMFGGHVDAAMQRVEGKTEALRRGNAENVLRSYLGLPKKFRDIGELAGRGKVKSEDRPAPPFPLE